MFRKIITTDSQETTILIRLMAGAVLMAIATTKAGVLANDGFREMMHGSRTDWSMLLNDKNSNG
jgi:hypothetical protein